MLAAFRLSFIRGHTVVFVSFFEWDFGGLFALFWHTGDQFAVASKKKKAKEQEKKDSISKDILY